MIKEHSAVTHSQAISVFMVFQLLHVLAVWKLFLHVHFIVDNNNIRPRYLENLFLGFFRPNYCIHVLYTTTLA